MLANTEAIQSEDELKEHLLKSPYRDPEQAEKKGLDLKMFEGFDFLPYGLKEANFEWIETSEDYDELQGSTASCFAAQLWPVDLVQDDSIALDSKIMLNKKDIHELILKGMLKSEPSEEKIASLTNEIVTDTEKRVVQEVGQNFGDSKILTTLENLRTLQGSASFKDMHYDDFREKVVEYDIVERFGYWALVANKPEEIDVKVARESTIFSHARLIGLDEDEKPEYDKSTIEARINLQISVTYEVEDKGTAYIVGDEKND